MLKYNKNISIFIVIITSLHPNNHLISSPVIKFLFIFHLLHGHERKKCDEFNLMVIQGVKLGIFLAGPFGST